MNLKYWLLLGLLVFIFSITLAVLGYRAYTTDLYFDSVEHNLSE